MRTFIKIAAICLHVAWMAGAQQSQMQNQQAAVVEPLLGKWTVKQAAVDKTVDGVTQTTVYHSAADVQSYIPCAQEWEINEQTIVLRYPNGYEITCPSYTVEGDLLYVNIIIALETWQYSMNGEDLILSATYSYVNNLPSGHTEQIAELWIVTLQKP